MRQALRTGAQVGLGMLGLFMLFGLLDVFNTNQPILHTQAKYQPAYQVLRWVRQNDSSDYYVRHTPTNAWQEATIANHLRFIDIWYHFADIRSLEGKVNQRWVQAQPLYLIQSPAEAVPEHGQLIQVVADTNIYRLPDSLPMAFLVGQDVLAQESSQWLRVEEVKPLSPFFSSTGKAELIAEGQGKQLLVLLITHYPGWRVEVDGAEQPLLNVGGYLAVEVLPGVHKYTFAYQPRQLLSRAGDQPGNHPDHCLRAAQGGEGNSPHAENSLAGCTRFARPGTGQAVYEVARPAAMDPPGSLPGWRPAPGSGAATGRTSPGYW